MTDNENTGSEDIGFELGDKILILGGQFDSLKGRIYYIDENLIRILPDGVSDRLVDLPIIDGDIDPSLQVDHIYSLSKRTNPAFVAQIGANVEQIAQTFGPNGELKTSFTIKAINETADSMVLADDTGDEVEVNFDFTGIPLDLPFAVIRPRELSGTDNIFANDGADGTATAEADAADAAATQEENLFEDLLESEMAGLRETGIGQIQEVEASERIYPDMDQRNDMIHDMIAALPLASQKNPEQQKRIRKLVEQCMFLRNSLVEYSRSGEPTGQIPTSFLTLSDLIKNRTLPLARPVIQSNRTLYLDHTGASLLASANGNPPQDPEEVAGADLDIKYLGDVVKATIQYMDTQLGGIQSQNLSADSLPAWFLSWETLNRVYHKSWSPIGTFDNTKFKQDSEFFQAPIPDILTPIVDSIQARGIDAETLLTSDFIGKTRISLLRGLGPRKTRLRERDPLLQVETAEEGSVINTLLFPLSEQRNLGVTRSGRIANDIAYSHQTPQTMTEILERLEGIPDVATAGGILSIGDDGNTLGNIPLEDWMAAQPLYPLGLADAIVALSNYGFSNFELNSDQQDALVDKIDKYRALIKQYIIELRDASTAELSKHKMENNPFLIGEAFSEFMAVLEGEPILASRIQEIRNKLPYYKNNDIAIIAGLLVTSSDLFLTTMAQVAGPLARERTRMVRDQFLEALSIALAKNLKEANAGEEPDENKCPHVADYNDIQKIKDDAQRMKIFAKFLTKYRGTREDNWVNCSACGKHLVCYHEVLLLQEFLHPREKDTLHKELILTFSGEQFHGRFTCKNCGQPLAELEYDTSIEFSDDGVPMSGRAVLQLESEAEKDVLDELLGPTAGGEDEIEFKTDTQTTSYRAARKIFDTVGVYGKEDAYKRIVQRVETEVLKQPSLEAYKQLTKGKRAMDYDVYINRILVSATAVNCVVELQTDIPGYVMRYKLPGCRAGFSGYPLGNEKDRTCIEYIACAVASIQENVAPWNLTGYLRDSSVAKRQEAILVDMTKLLGALLTNATVQQQLSMKRAHLQDLYGSIVYSEQLPEYIPEGFAPFPYKPDEEAVVIPEAAGPRERIRGWILQAHKISKDNGVYVKGNPYSDATCCLMPIQKPGSFWKAGDLVALPVKAPPLGPVKSHLGIHFVPRPYEVLEGVVSPEIIYRIFLKVCYDGPQKGLPHEPGYTNTCKFCGFVFPESPYVPRVFPPITSNTKDLKAYFEDIDAIITKGKIALETQGVIINKGTFEEILDATHTAFKVAPYVKKMPIAGMNLFEMLRRIEPEPFEGWRQMLTLTMEGLSKLTPGADDIEIAEAYGEISNFAAKTIGDFETRLGTDSARLIQQILESGPNQMIETVRTYFLIPFQRLVSGFHTGSLVFNKLAPPTNDDINKALQIHLEYLGLLAKRATGSTLNKLQWSRDRLSDSLEILKKYIRGPTIPGGTLGLSYVTTALIGGILADFMNPNSVPPGFSEASAAVNSGARAPIQIIDVCIQKIRVEGLNFTAEQIKEMIARRDQLEKNTYIKKYDNLTPEEKAVAKMNKKLGLKEWAVGGTKAIYAYDPEQYERERVQRLEMGFTDFMPVGDVRIAGDTGAEGGYDNAQMAEEDY
jgi:hypothetical protein